MARLNPTQPAPAPPPPPPSIDALRTHFLQTLSLSVKASWLAATLAALTQSAHPPAGAALHLSLKGRLLGSDLTASLDPHANQCFAPTIHTQHRAMLAGPVAAQVLAVADVGVSRGAELERLEEAARGEATRGRAVVRLVDEEAAGVEVRRREGRGEGRGCCRLLLEDAAGRRAWGVELKPVEGVKPEMAVGTKVVLRGCEIARGCVMLTGEGCTVLGGKIEALQREWEQGRIEALKAEIEELRTRAA